MRSSPVRVASWEHGPKTISSLHPSNYGVDKLLTQSAGCMPMPAKELLGEGRGEHE